MDHRLARGQARVPSEAVKEVVCGISTELLHPLVWVAEEVEAGVRKVVFFCL